MNTWLAKHMAADGEGASALFEVKVVGAQSKEQAVTLSKSVITSSLVKTAICGHDANWGRILCAMAIPALPLTRSGWICILRAAPGS